MKQAPGRVRGVAPAKVGFAPPSSSPMAAVERFRCDNTKLLQIVRRLEMDWPNANNIFRRLAEYLTDGLVVERGRFAHGGGSLVSIYSMGLDCGLMRYDAAQDQPDDLRFHAFVTATLAETARLLRGVVVMSGSRSWCPAKGTPLMDWLRHADGVRVTPVANGPTGDDIYLALYRFALTDNDRLILAEL